MTLTCIAVSVVAARGVCCADIFDFYRFYILEYRFRGNVGRYETFVSKWVPPRVGFFSYPAWALAEAQGVIQGMREALAHCQPTSASEANNSSASNANSSANTLWLEEIAREIGIDDILAGYIETRSVIATEPAEGSGGGAIPSNASTAATQPPVSSSTVSSSTDVADVAGTGLSHHCSQVVIWGELTGGGSGLPGSGSVIGGRNMDGEIDLRKVTASHSVLIATERDPHPLPPPPAASAAPPASCAPASSSFRTISLMWPGLVGTLTGVNETGLYLCENAGETAPGSGLVSGLVPVGCVQLEALRRLDARGGRLGPHQAQTFLQQFVSDRGWDLAAHTPISAAQRTQRQARKNLPRYASHTTRGGFSGPGSIFVFATPPLPSSASASDSASDSVSASTSASLAAAPIHGFVVESDRCHTAVRTPDVSLPQPREVPDCILATNHALSLGFDDLGVLPFTPPPPSSSSAATPAPAATTSSSSSAAPESESESLLHARARLWAHEKCASLASAYSGGSAGSGSGRLTNWNVLLDPKSTWRFEAGRNKLQAMHRARTVAAKAKGQQHKEPMGVEQVKDMLRTMCPGQCALRTDGRASVWQCVCSSH